MLLDTAKIILYRTLKLKKPREPHDEFHSYPGPRCENFLWPLNIDGDATKRAAAEPHQKRSYSLFPAKRILRHRQIISSHQCFRWAFPCQIAW